MRILQAHNFYQQPGGEDVVCSAEYKLLSMRGHSVEQYLLHNRDIEAQSQVGAALRSIWNPTTYREIREAIQTCRPSVIHAHNTFPLISPSLYYAAEAERVPVVQTLHNFRLICPAATLYRDGRVCEDCATKSVPYNGVLHGCYKGSYLASGTVAALLTVHRMAQTWKRRIQTYVAPNAFAKRMFIAGGLPAGKIVVKPNFVLEDPGPGRSEGGFALFAGRLCEEKGVRTMLLAWENIPGWRLVIAGDGPLRDFVQERVQSLKQATWVGQCERDRITSLMRSAAFLVLPSENYETGPLSALEAMACGCPVLCSDIGPFRDLIKEGVNGAHFKIGDAADLAAKANHWTSRPQELEQLRQGSRAMYESHYTSERNYESLMQIYDKAVEESGY